MQYSINSAEKSGRPSGRTLGWIHTLLLVSGSIPGGSSDLNFLKCWKDLGEIYSQMNTGMGASKKLPSMAFAIEAIQKQTITLETLHIMCANTNKNKFERVMSSKEKNAPIFLIMKTFQKEKVLFCEKGMG